MKRSSHRARAKLAEWNPQPEWVSPLRYLQLFRSETKVNLDSLGEFLLPSSPLFYQKTPMPIPRSKTKSSKPKTFLTFLKPSLLGFTESYIHLECGKEAQLSRRIVRTSKKCGCNVLIPVDPSKPGRRPKSPPKSTVCQCGNAARYIFHLLGGYRFFVCASHFAYWEARRKRLVPRKARRKKTQRAS